MGCVTVTGATDNGVRCATTLVSLRRWAEGRHNDFKNGGCFISRTKGGTTRNRLHAEGRAMDISLRNWKRAANNEAMWALVNGIVDAHCSLGIQRVMFDKKVWTADDGVQVGPAGWTDLTAAQLRSGQYRDHAHFEVDVEHKDTYTVEDIQRILASVYIPGGNNDGVTPPPGDLNTGTPATAPTLDRTDTSGQWTREAMLATCAPIIEDTPADQIGTYVICGGRGGYCVNFANGKIRSVGFGVDWTAQVGGPITDFVPYQAGYFVLLTDGTVEGYGYTVPTFDCDESGVWDHISSPETGVIVVSKTNPTTLRVTQCAAWFENNAWTYITDVCCEQYVPLPDADGGFIPIFP